jgi:hypothetical protein
MDLHASQIQGFFDVPVDNVSRLFRRRYGQVLACLSAPVGRSTAGGGLAPPAAPRTRR